MSNLVHFNAYVTNSTHTRRRTRLSSLPPLGSSLPPPVADMAALLARSPAAAAVVHDIIVDVLGRLDARQSS